MFTYDQGAEVLYAPGLVDLDEIARLVREVAAPVNVLALPGGPSVAEIPAKMVISAGAGDQTVADFHSMTDVLVAALGGVCRRGFTVPDVQPTRLASSGKHGG